MTLPALPSRPVPEGHDQVWGFYAVEYEIGKARFLVAVLPAPSETWAVVKVGELYPTHFDPQDVLGTLVAREVACPGVANPMAIDGWIHYEGPHNVRCPRCYRSHQHPHPGMRVSVRIVGTLAAGRPAAQGHTRDRCKKCKAELEFAITAVGSPPPRLFKHPRKG